MEPSIIAFIPIRKGSKGVPNKNMRILGDKPLICWVLDTLLNSKLFTEIWVATDSKYAEQFLLKRYQDTVHFFRRSDKSATDDAPVIDVLTEFLRSKSEALDSIIFLSQATVPFVSVSDISAAVSMILKDSEHDSWISCSRVKKLCWTKEGQSLNYALDKKPRRQEYDGILVENGAFYASKGSTIMETGMVISKKIAVIESSHGTELDIDTEEDWKMAELFVKYGLYS